MEFDMAPVADVLQNQAIGWVFDDLWEIVWNNPDLDEWVQYCLLWAIGDLIHMENMVRNPLERYCKEVIPDSFVLPF